MVLKFNCEIDSPKNLQKSVEEIRQKSEKGNPPRENPPKVELVKFSILL